MSAASDQTGATGSSTSSTLSAEAAEFVPARLAQSDSSDTRPRTDGGGGSGGKSLAEVPRFLTTCYPFVNLSASPGVKAGGETSGSVTGGGRGFAPASAYPPGNLQHACPHLGPFPAQVGFVPATPHPWLPSLQPTAAFTPTLPVPLTPGVHMPFDGGTSTPAGRGLLPTPSKGDGLLPTPPYPRMNGPAVLPSAPTPAAAPAVMMSYPSTPLVVAADRNLVTAGPARNPMAQAGRGRGHATNVSRGTQREAFSMPSSGRTHTIIMKDNSVQTDFSRDMADLTLQEKASPLYRRGQRRNKGSQPIASTDSEEVDSDSGYSSPLHRRNLVSNGTHPVPLASMQELSKVTTPERGKTSTLIPSLLSVLPASSSAMEGQTSKVTSAAGSAAPTGEGPMMSRVESLPTSAWSKDVSYAASLASKDGSGPTPSVWGKSLAGKTAAAVTERPRVPSGVRDLMSGEEEGRGGGVGVVTPQDAQLQRRGSSSSISSSNNTTAARHIPTPTPTPTPAPTPNPTTSTRESLVGAKSPHSPGSSRRTGVPSPVPPPEFPILKPARRHEPPWSLTPAVAKVGKRGESSGFMGMMADSVKSYASIVKSLSSPVLDGPTPPSSQHLPQTAETAFSNCPSAATTGSLVTSVPVIGGTVSGSEVTEVGSSALRVVGGSSTPTDSNIPGRGPSHSQAGGAGGPGSGWDHSQGRGGNPGTFQTLPPHDSLQQGSAHSQQAGGAGSNKGPSHSQGGVGGRKKGPVWVGKEGTVLKGRLAEGSGRPSSNATGSQGNQAGVKVGDSQVARKGQNPEHSSNQTCGTAHQGINEGTPPSSSGDFPPLGRTGDTARPPQLPSGDCNPHCVGEGVSKTENALSAVSGDEKMEEEEEGKKKRRRRRRRRRRGRTTGEGEGLSDGMSGLERTVSSSNISRTSDVTLHFEDELEFPELGAASGNEGAFSVVSGNEGSFRVASSNEEARSVRESPVSAAVSEVKPPGYRYDPLTWINYSDILKRKPSLNDVRSRTQSAPGSCLSGEEGGDENFNSQPGQGMGGQAPLSKRARKRRKRRELANRAAEAELAEILLEQQVLRELGHKVAGRGSRPSSGSREERSRSREEKSPARGLITDQAVVRQAKGVGGQGSGKRLHQPIALSIADMLDAFEKKKSQDQKTASLLGGAPKREEKKKLTGNVLDGNAPMKRGKERETPKPKKPSPLKKVILKEREEKKRMRMIGDCDVYSGGELPDNTDAEPDTDPDNDPENNLIDDNDNTGNPVGLGESDLSQDGLSGRSVDTDQGVSPGADLSPISQTSPLSMSPLTPGASPLNSPIAGYLSRDPVVLRIHSRRFREYCTQILDKDIDMCCTALLHELVRFQDRVYHKDPNKAKGKRRVVLGLREVTKHLKLKKIKCVIISPNLEKIQSKGGLDEALNNILNMCQEQNVPFVFALGRRALGRACAKLVPVSVAGIFNYEGCEEKFNQLISLTHKGRQAYSEMVRAVEREIAENPPPPVGVAMGAGSSHPSLYAHMGHSRTPSGCSAISFTSSVLSEPISENYPHAEPETDSKGYEILRDHDGNVVPYAAPGAVANGPSVHSAYGDDDIDDGNEADTEEVNDGPPRRRRRGEESRGRGEGEGGWQEGGAGTPPSTSTPTQPLSPRHEQDAASDDGDSASESDSQRLDAGEGEGECTAAASSAARLPHIDSIHSAMHDLSAEILSQHSSRTLDNSEALSTHSSRTLGDGSLTPGRERPHTPESWGSRAGAPRGGGRVTTKERVANWVESCLQEEQDVPSLGDSGGEGEDGVVEGVGL